MGFKRSLLGAAPARACVVVFRRSRRACRSCFDFRGGCPLGLRPGRTPAGGASGNRRAMLKKQEVWIHAQRHMGPGASVPERGKRGAMSGWPRPGGFPEARPLPSVKDIFAGCNRYFGNTNLLKGVADVFRGGGPPVGCGGAAARLVCSKGRVRLPGGSG